MHSVYQEVSAETAQSPSADSTSHHLLQEVLRVSQEWMARLPAHDPHRQDVVRLGMLSEGLVSAGDHSSDAMATARSLLCVNCRRLNAAQGQCTGQSLDRCLLLNGSRPSVPHTPFTKADAVCPRP